MIEILSGVSAFTGNPFCQVLVDGKTVGQLSPTEVRTMALHWLEAAEAAEMDSMVMAEMTDPTGLNLGKRVAAEFVAALRKRRDPR